MSCEQYDAQWVCAECGRHYVVPCLARDCEVAHARLARLHAVS